MKDSISKKIIIAILALWVFLWINFTVRDLHRKKYFNDYKELIKRSAQEKRAYTYGEHFYEFLKFSESNIPRDSTYDFIGVENRSLAWRRGIYYLYPRIRKDNPDFLLIYNAPKKITANFMPYKKLDNNRLILKRR